MAAKIISKKNITFKNTNTNKYTTVAKIQTWDEGGESVQITQGQLETLLQAIKNNQVKYKIYNNIEYYSLYVFVDDGKFDKKIELKSDDIPF